MRGCSLGVMIAPPGIEDVEALRDGVSGGGITGLWWPDHWMGWGPGAAWEDVGELASAWPSPDLYSDPFVEMAVYGRETGAPVLGTCVTDVVRRHPVGVLQSVETVLRLATSSFVVLGVGAGERENLEPYGLPQPRVGRVEEYLEVVRQAADGGRVSFAGEHFVLDDAPVPAPLSRERLAVWVGAHGPRMLDITARCADGWMPMGFPATLVARRRGKIDAARPDGAAPIRSGVCVVIALIEDESDVEAVVTSPVMKRLALFSGSSVFTAAGHSHPFGDAFNPMTSYVPSRLGEEEVRAAVSAVPDEVVSRVVRLVTREGLAALVDEYDEAGVDHLIVWDVMHLVHPQSRTRSIQLLCDAVRPQPTKEGAHAGQ